MNLEPTSSTKKPLKRLSAYDINQKLMDIENEGIKEFVDTHLPEHLKLGKMIIKAQAKGWLVKAGCVRERGRCLNKWRIVDNRIIHGIRGVKKQVSNKEVNMSEERKKKVKFKNSLENTEYDKRYYDGSDIDSDKEDD
jgi:hypothetical protein